jgi:hypothetical protein
MMLDVCVCIYVCVHVCLYVLQDGLCELSGDQCVCVSRSGNVS